MYFIKKGKKDENITLVTKELYKLNICKICNCNITHMNNHKRTMKHLENLIEYRIQEEILTEN